MHYESGFYNRGLYSRGELNMIDIVQAIDEIIRVSRGYLEISISESIEIVKEWMRLV